MKELEFFSAKRTDPAFAESSGSEVIYKTSRAKGNGYVKQKGYREEEKTRTSGRYETLGIPGHGDTKNIAKNHQKLKPKTRRATEAKHE